MIIYVYHDGDDNTMEAFSTLKQAKAKAEDEWWSHSIGTQSDENEWTEDNRKTGKRHYFGEYVTIHELEVQL